jgi:hypothetical protein
MARIVLVVVHTVYSGYRDAPALGGAAGFAVKSPGLAELAGVVDRILAPGSRRSPG